MNQDKPSESILESAGEIFEYTKAYAQVQIDQAKLELVERSSKALSALVTLFVMLFIVSLGLFFALVALALFIGNYLESSSLGFLAVGGGVLLIGLGIYSSRRHLITNPIIELIIKSIYD